MRAYRLPVVITAVALMLTVPAVNANAAEDVLTRIPGDCLAFVAINKVETAQADLNKFMTDSGLRSYYPADMIEMAKGMLLLGEGFDDEGGVALMILNPTTFGWDISTLLTTPPTSPPPAALLLPGKDPMKLLAFYNPVKADGMVKVMFKGQPLLAKAVGDYTAVAMTPETLENVVTCETSAAKAMPDDHKKVFEKCMIGAYMRLEPLVPAIMASMDKAMADMKRMTDMGYIDPITASVMSTYASMMPMYRDALVQLEAITLGLRAGESSMVVDFLETYRPDTRYGKLLDKLKTPKADLLKTVPSLPYVLALGAIGNAAFEGGVQDDLMAMNIEWVELVLQGEFAKTYLDEGEIARAREIAKTYLEQITSVDFVVGGAPADKGVFGLGMVIKATDPAKVMATMPEVVRLKDKVITGLLQDAGEDDQELKLLYRKAVTSIDGQAVDAIEIQIAEMANMSDRDAEAMTKVLGEPRIRFLLTQVDKDKIAMTFGGTEAMLAETVKTAKDGGPIAGDKNVVAAMADLPKKPCFATVLSYPNLLTVVRTFVKTMNPPNAPHAQQFLGMLNSIPVTTPRPIALGAAFEGAGARYTLSIPSGTVKDISQAAMMMIMQKSKMMAPQGGQMPDMESF